MTCCNAIATFINSNISPFKFQVAKARNTMLGSPYTGTAGSFGRPQFGSSFGRAPIVTGMMPGVGSYRPRSRFPPPGPRPVQAGGSIVRGSSMLRQQHATAVTNYALAVSMPIISDWIQNGDSALTRLIKDADCSEDSSSTYDC